MTLPQAVRQFLDETGDISRFVSRFSPKDLNRDTNSVKEFAQYPAKFATP